MTRVRIPALLVLVLAVPVLTVSSVRGEGFTGRLALELEYLGENYFNEITLPSPIVLDDGIRETDTTRFNDDSWLPGQHLELQWQREPGEATRFEIRTDTRYNRETFDQGVDLQLERAAADGGAWTLEASGTFRDEARSLVGSGDWGAEVAATRRLPLGEAWESDLRATWKHSRTRGDTTSFLYDFDVFTAKAEVLGGGGWSPAWVMRLEGTRKQVPGDLEGAYTEGTLGAAWHPPGPGRLRLGADVTLRNYDRDGDVGRDYLEVDAEAGHLLWSRGNHAVEASLDLSTADYATSDDLYYDFGQATLFLPWQWDDGTWNTSLGPRARVVSDLGGGDRDYAQWSVRSEAGRSLGIGGFFQVSLETGFRNYRGEGELIELTTLSTTLLRSDYWLWDAMVLGEVPLGSGFSLEILGDTLLEVHTAESERVQVTFATLSVVHGF